jgi:hypothetical protein
MRAERIKLNEAKIQYRGLVNAAMYVHSSSVNSRNSFKSFVIRILLHVAGYFDIFFHLEQEANI